MPVFKTTNTIFKTPHQDELFDARLIETDIAKFPPKKQWDYKKELKIEDVEIWEEICLMSGGTGLYAAWNPYAEFYMIIKNIYWVSNETDVETFYGPMASEKAYKRARQLRMPVTMNKLWVEPEDMWLYTKQDYKKTKILH